MMHVKRNYLSAR